MRLFTLLALLGASFGCAAPPDPVVKTVEGTPCARECNLIYSDCTQKARSAPYTMIIEQRACAENEKSCYAACVWPQNPRY